MSITATTGTMESRTRFVSPYTKGILTGLLCALLSAYPNAAFEAHESMLPKDSLDEVMTRGTLRVVSRVNPATFVIDKHGPSGIEFELARAFAADLGVELEMLPAANIGDAYSALDRGVADIAASGLTARVEGKLSYLYSSPYLEVSQQIVYRSGTRRPSSMNDLAGARVMVLAQTSSADALRDTQHALPALSWQEATRIETFELLKKIVDGEIDYAVVKSNEFFMHQGLFPGLEVAFEIERPEQLSWATSRKRHNSRLYQTMQSFLGAYEASGDLDLLRERFFGYLPEINRRALKAFAERADRQLPRLEKVMRRIGKEEGVDWRLLAAISYQESHWNPQAVSRTGVAGMMMLTKATAAEVGVSDRRNMEQSLRGGARYFHDLLSQVSEDIAPPDRELFALAAYNIGPGHVEDARKLATLRGADPNVWAEVEPQLLLLSKREWHSRTRYGYARGFETASFVNRIRQYHRFLLHHNEGGELFQLAMGGSSGTYFSPAKS